MGGDGVIEVDGSSGGDRDSTLVGTS